MTRTQEPAASHSAISPAILYWGTPVVLVSTTNEDGSTNICPMSSAFWLGDRGFLGLAFLNKTAENLLRTGQCVLNLASDDMGDAINGLARTSGSDPVPEPKQKMGYRHVKDKFGVAGLTPQVSEFVKPLRIQECPVQMEAELVGHYTGMDGFLNIIEVRILKTWVIDSLRLPGYANRIDPDAWHPMIMMFQHLYGLRNGKAVESKLAEIDEEVYRPSRGEGMVVPNSGPDVHGLTTKQDY